MPLLREVERVWIRVKDLAADLAARSEVPSADTAWAHIERIVHEELAFSAPVEAREFFAHELRQMTARKVANLSSLMERTRA